MRFWKVQKFFGDVVYDLRQRGLLPVAIALLVAMVAIPLVISRGGSKAPPPSSSTDVEQAANLAPENQKAVLAYNPGLRNYKDRLKDLAAKDPFTQQFAQAPDAATETADAGSAASATDVTDIGGGGGGGSATPDTGGSTDTGSSGGGTTKSTVKYFYSQADVLAGDAAAPLQRFNKLTSFTPLPSQYTAVAIFAGATLDAKQTYFIVSTDVSQVSGEGACAPSPTDCALLSLKAGQSASLLYDVDGKTYTIKVLKIKRVVSKKPPKQ